MFNMRNLNKKVESVKERYERLRKARIRSQGLSLERALFNLNADMGEHILFKAKVNNNNNNGKKAEENKENDTAEKEKKNNTENPNRAAVDNLFDGRPLAKINTDNLKMILDKLDGMSKTNRYASVALDRVYAEYLTRITGAGSHAQSKGTEKTTEGNNTKDKLQDLNTKINAAEKSLNGTNDTKKKNKLKAKLNGYKQERDKLRKHLGGN